MKLRKGDKVLIMRTGQVATVLDIELIRKHGRVHRYCKVQPRSGKPALWMDGSELGNVVEKVTATYTSDLAGHSIAVELLFNHEKGTLNVKCEALNPKNLEGQIGMHGYLVSQVLRSFGWPEHVTMVEHEGEA